MAIKHGMATTPTYCVWQAMRQRCTNPNNPRYPHYGGRGIKYCERWEEFKNFYEDMGEKPKGLTIDRKDNDGNYQPDNCHWATYSVQNRNTRNNRNITFNGRTQCMMAWANETGIKYMTILFRLRYGWTVERTLTEPVIPRKYSRR
jgi:hypothetical protein